MGKEKAVRNRLEHLCDERENGHLTTLPFLKAEFNFCQGLESCFWKAKVSGSVTDFTCTRRSPSPV